MAKKKEIQADAPKPKLEKLPMMGTDGAPVLVVCDPPPLGPWKEGNKVILYPKAKQLFLRTAAECGYREKDFLFVCPCPPIPEEIEASEKRIGDFIAPYAARLLDIIAEQQPQFIIYLGKHAGRLTMGRPVQIMKARGSFVQGDFSGVPIPVLPMLSPNHVLRRPENHDIFATDFLMAKKLREENFSLKRVQKTTNADKEYKWVTDIQFLLDNPPKAIAADTETTGLKWYTAGSGKPGAVKVLTVQICYAPGKAVCVPVDCDYYPALTPKKRTKVIAQLKELLENPKVRKTGHNVKYDTHMLRDDLGIYVDDWAHDTQILAFVVDENMQEKSLDECVRRWVPEMAGYNDVYNRKLNKEDMRSVSHDDMLNYGCGDVDASYRLAMVLSGLAKSDKRQYRCYEKIILPAIKAFADPVELYGIKVDTKALSGLQVSLGDAEREMYASLIAQVPKSIKRKHAEKGLKFTRDEFVRDILFTKEGLGLKPRVWTKSTARLPEKERVPSVSTKQHMPYFTDEPFVEQYMQYSKLQKLRSTYVGVPHDKEKGGPTGFWQYIHQGEIHPSFMLHRVVTGRTASASPNGQNFPKRGELAKSYRKIFVARPGYTLIETDLSQAELRIAGWMANEKNMINIYATGGDIHTNTAAGTLGINLSKFKSWEGNDNPAGDLGNLPGLRDFLLKEGNSATIAQFFDYKRFQAKACNFGFLYGMWWKKFKAYAKTDYGIDLTDEQAQEMREVFFATYPGLEDWHESTRKWVRDKGYVRALHGALRRLPSVHSDVDYIRQEAERQAINAPVQRFASDLGLIAMVRLVRDADPEIIRPLMFVHDALVLEVKNEYAERAQGWVKFYMETPPLKEWFNLTPPIPIVADIAQGLNLGEMGKCKGAVATAPNWYNKKADLAA